MKKILFALCLLLIVPAALAASDYQITFQTKDCNGDTGLATVAINTIYKIETTTCEPPFEKKQRKQILIKSKRSLTSTNAAALLPENRKDTVLVDSYDVMTVTEEEAIAIQQEIEKYMHAKRKLLENGKAVIIE